MFLKTQMFYLKYVCILGVLFSGCSNNKGTVFRRQSAVTRSNNPITLTITPSQSAYAVDVNKYAALPVEFCLLQSDIAFTATLANQSQESIAVSLFDVGNLSVLDFRKDGTPITGRAGAVSFHNPPTEAQQRLLTEIAPGSSAKFKFSGICPVVYETGSPIKMTTFPYLGPGVYKVVFGYHYSGPDANKKNVFHGVIASNEVIFHVQ